MKPEIRKYLLDIETSISSIEEYLGAERNFKKYEANKLLRRGIERENFSKEKKKGGFHHLKAAFPFSAAA